MSSLKLINNIINQRGTPAFNSNTIANRPAAGYVGRIFISTDTFVIQRDNGVSWDNIGGGGITGSGAAGQVAFWTGASAQGGDNAIFWDNTNKRLGLGTTTPGVRLDIHGTGVIQQLNGTTTNNAYLDFQNAGTTQWRVGNTYNGGNRLFQVIDQAAGGRNSILINNLGNIGFNIPGNTFYGAAAKCLVEFYQNPATNTQQPQMNRFANNNNGLCWTDGYFFTRGATFGTYSASLSGDVLYSLNILGSSNSAYIYGGYLAWQQNGSVGTSCPTDCIIQSYTASSVISAELKLTPNSNSIFSSRLNVNNATDNALFELNVNGNTYTGGLSPTILTVSTNTTMARTATGYYCTATLTLTLPSAASINNVYWVIAASGVTVTVNRAGTDDILNLAGTSVTSITITSNQRAMFYVGGGTRTFLISQA